MSQLWHLIPILWNRLQIIFASTSQAVHLALLARALGLNWVVLLYIWLAGRKRQRLCFIKVRVVKQELDLCMRLPRATRKVFPALADIRWNLDPFKIFLSLSLLWSKKLVTQQQQQQGSHQQIWSKNLILLFCAEISTHLMMVRRHDSWPNGISPKTNRPTAYSSRF